MTATKSPPKFDPNGPITNFQIKRIRQNCNFDESIKEEWVQWVTGDVKCKSLKSLNQAQAVKIICQQTGQPLPIGYSENWGAFNFNNPKHLLIMSLVRQRQWTKPHPKHGEVADMTGAFAEWLQSKRSPVQKPLMDMNASDLEKIIKALGGVVNSKY